MLTSQESDYESNMVMAARDAFRELLRAALVSRTDIFEDNMADTMADEAFVLGHAFATAALREQDKLHEIEGEDN